ncbi:hypothetical protein F4604DRAFT_1678431 [Suillus subluteus]|nr:hypothetical protein F4604DRAFT_1678431 [Suillus subluteus]
MMGGKDGMSMQTCVAAYSDIIGGGMRTKTLECPVQLDNHISANEAIEPDSSSSTIGASDVESYSTKIVPELTEGVSEFGVVAVEVAEYILCVVEAEEITISVRKESQDLKDAQSSIAETAPAICTHCQRRYHVQRWVFSDTDLVLGEGAAKVVDVDKFARGTCRALGGGGLAWGRGGYYCGEDGCEYCVCLFYVQELGPPSFILSATREVCQAPKRSGGIFKSAQQSRNSSVLLHSCTMPLGSSSQQLDNTVTRQLLESTTLSVGDQRLRDAKSKTTRYGTQTAREDSDQAQRMWHEVARLNNTLK